MWQNDLVLPCAHNGRSQPVSLFPPMSHRFLLAAVAAAFSAAAAATDVNVIGLFPGKAVVVIDRGMPRTLSVGQRTTEGVLLVDADSKSATLEIDGKRQRYEMGQHFETA